MRAGRVVALLAWILAIGSVNSTSAQDGADALSLSRAPGYDARAAEQTLRSGFAGVWQVQLNPDPSDLTDGGTFGPYSGSATITVERGAPTMVLQTGAGPVRYGATEFDAQLFAPGTGPFASDLKVRFRRTDPAVAGSSTPADRAATDLALQAGAREIVLSLGAATVRTAVGERPSAPEALFVSLGARDDANRLAGIWRDETSGERRGGGRAEWIRGRPEILGIVVIDDQFATSAPSRDGETVAAASRNRTLVLYGRNLPSSGESASLRSTDPSVSYTGNFTVGPNAGAAVEAARQRLEAQADALRALARNDVADMLDARRRLMDRNDRLAVTALLAPDAAPGEKEIVVNGTVATWPLIFGDVRARLAFTGETADDALDWAFPGMSLYLTLTFDAASLSDAVDIVLRTGGPAGREVGRLTARPSAPEAGAQPDTLRAGPIRLVDTIDPSRAPPSAEGALTLPVSYGAVLSAAIADPAVARTEPRHVELTIEAPNADASPFWEGALRRVARCRGETYSGRDYERTSIGTAQFDAGDQAAAILIRDEFLARVGPRVRVYARIVADRGAVTAFRNAAATDPLIAADPVWRERVSFAQVGGTIATVVREERMALAETLDDTNLARLGIDTDLARSWAVDQTRAALEQQISRMLAALGQVSAMGDCDLEALLTIAGFRTVDLTDAIRPRLLILETENAQSYWRPDSEARAKLASLYVAAGAYRAGDEYGVLKNLVAASAIVFAATLVSGGTGTLGALALAGNIALAAEPGIGYLLAERDYAFAEGAAPVAGSEILDAAQQRRRDPLLTAAMTALGGWTSASGLRGLRSAAARDAGAALVRAEGAGVIRDAARLTAAEREALGAYAYDIARRAVQGGRGVLDDTERAVLETIESELERRGGRLPGNVAGGVPEANASAAADAAAVARGRFLLAREGDDIADLARYTDAEREAMAAYYGELMKRLDRHGLEGLAASEREAIRRFEGYFQRPTPVAGTGCPMGGKLGVEFQLFMENCGLVAAEPILRELNILPANAARPQRVLRAFAEKERMLLPGSGMRGQDIANYFKAHGVPDDLVRVGEMSAADIGRAISRGEDVISLIRLPPDAQGKELYHWVRVESAFTDVQGVRRLSFGEGNAPLDISHRRAFAEFDGHLNRASNGTRLTSVVINGRGLGNAARAAAREKSRQITVEGARALIGNPGPELIRPR